MAKSYMECAKGAEHEIPELDSQYTWADGLSDVQRFMKKDLPRLKRDSRNIEIGRNYHFCKCTRQIWTSHLKNKQNWPVFGRHKPNFAKWTCSECGHYVAGGWRIEFSNHYRVNIPATRCAHCYDADETPNSFEADKHC